MIEAVLQAVVAIVVAGLSVLGAVLATERTSGLQRRIKHNVGILKDAPEGRARAGLEATLELQVEAYAKRETARIKRKVNWGSVFWTVVFTLLCLWAVSGCVSWWLSSGGNPLAVTVTIVVGLFSALFVGAALSTIYNPSAKDKKAAAAEAATNAPE